MKTVRVLALVLVIVGAVNWGLMGVAQFDLVAALFNGPQSPLSRVIYSLVGLAGLGLLGLELGLTTQPRLQTVRAK